MFKQLYNLNRKLYAVIFYRHLESEPNQEASTSGVQNTIQIKALKPWRCCMCKTRSTSQEGIENHVLEKHEIDSQYKCALCSYKTNNKDTFTSHFKDIHDNKEIDIIYVYRKIEEGPKEDKEEAFDTTPLWQRDRPRVRHIRGILFEETATIPSKSPKKTPNKITSPVPVINKPVTICESPKTPSATNLDLAIESVVNGTADILQVKVATPSMKQVSSLFSFVLCIFDSNVLVK